jgi:hypothetical protein
MRSWHTQALDPFDGLRKLQIPAKRVCKLHLSRGPAISLKNLTRTDKDAQAFRAGGRNIQSVRTVEEFHAAWGIGMAGGRHRIDDDRGFLSLEFIDRANPPTRNLLLKLKDLGIVGSDDQDIMKSDGRFCAVAIAPSSTRLDNLGDEFADFVGLFGGGTLASFVKDGQKSKA